MEMGAVVLPKALEANLPVVVCPLPLVALVASSVIALGYTLDLLLELILLMIASLSFVGYVRSRRVVMFVWSLAFSDAPSIDDTRRLSRLTRSCVSAFTCCYPICGWFRCSSR